MARKQSKNKNAKAVSTRFGAGCLVLFAAPFAGVSLFMGYLFVSNITQWRDAANWAETTAKLTSLELERSSGSEGGTTYQVIASYTYSFEERQYHGDRVGFSSSSDNIGSYQRRTYNRLKRLKDQGKPVPVYVNPQSPNEALLDRTLRLEMMVFYLPFVLGFGGAGFGILGFAAPRVLRELGRQRWAKELPEEPWNWRPDWAAGEVVHSSRAKATAWIIATLAWNLFCGAVLAITLMTNWPGAVLTSVIIGVNVVGGILVLLALRSCWRAWRFGASRLRLASVPGVIGGRLMGVVEIPTAVDTPEGFNTTLVCQETRTTTSGGESSTQTFTIWEQERVIAQTLRSDQPNHTAVPIAFTLPSSVTATDPDANKPINWKLVVKAKTTGPDYHAEFDVPVFRTEDSQEGITVEDEPLTQYEAELTLPELMAGQRIVLTESTGGDQLTVTAPPLRSLGNSLAILAFAIGWTGVVVFLFSQGFWFFFAVFSFFDLLIWYATGEAILASSELQIRGDRWAVRTGWYGIRRQHLFEQHDIKSITRKQVMSSSSSKGTQRWVNIQVKLRDKKNYVLVKHLSNKRAEDALLAELRRRAGLDQNKRVRKDDESREWQDLMDLPPEEA